ncbi:hypothetical protein [Halobacillus sp. BBL2006]|uniref:hypothetical protein n=1 Tax=Halobacillus sp. BBL2006 TaxID=1543706 RepID=UPI0005444BA6|nr:hypothetical protein [Halobacillus sp. BBL2006]KHE72465.1 hypothetical protein LD39_04365 [Halobacillus sp. BBL2006]
MLLMLVLGFIIPWLTAGYVYKKTPKLFFTVAPFAALIALILNQFGIQLGLWTIHPPSKVVMMDSIFLDLGIFTVSAIWFTYFLYYKQKNPLWVYPLFVLGMTGVEGIAILIHTLTYDEKWNIFYTFLMYLGGFMTIHLITRKLDKLEVYP